MRVQIRNPKWSESHEAGMTLRQWYAGQCLLGFIANDRTLTHDNRIPDLTSENDKNAIAQICFGMADAMLLENSR